MLSRTFALENNISVAPCEVRPRLIAYMLIVYGKISGK